MSQPESKQKEVYFGSYCPICKHANVPESEEPCNECMMSPSNWDSHRPVKWEHK